MDGAGARAESRTAQQSDGFAAAKPGNHPRMDGAGAHADSRPSQKQDSQAAPGAAAGLLTRTGNKEA